MVFDGVGKIFVDGAHGPAGYGTASLIGKQFLITAKHNFPGTFPNNLKAGGNIHFDAKTSSGIKYIESVSFKLENVIFVGDADLAIIKLDKVPLNIDSYQLYSGAPGSEVGKELFHVG